MCKASIPGKETASELSQVQVDLPSTAALLSVIASLKFTSATFSLLLVSTLGFKLIHSEEQYQFSYLMLQHAVFALT